MGADLYIEVLHEQHRAKTELAFQKAVTARDKHAKQHGCDLRWTDKEEQTSDCPRLVKLQAAVSKAYDAMTSDDPGYYRDSYNNSNLLWRLEYQNGDGPNSYWQDIKTDRNGNMSVRRAKAWLKAVKGARIRKVGEGESEVGASWASQLTPEQRKEWDDYFTEKKAKLEAFLQRAIDLKQPIRCSC